MNSAHDRVSRVGLARADPIIAIAIGLLLEIEALSARAIHGSHRTVTAIAGVLLVAPLAVRRRRPAAALLFSATVACLQSQLGGKLGSTSGVGMLLTLALLSYSAGAWLALGPAVLALTVAAALFAAFSAEIESSLVAALAPTLLAVGAPWGLGRMVHERARRAGAFRELALQTEREQAEREHAAVAHERLRISVELQDIIAHSVSAMVIQAAAARRLLASDPELARATIREVERTGRQTLADLRHLLGMLRRDDDPSALAPQPGLGQLQALLTAMGDRGLQCELHRHGEQLELTPGIDLVGYRVVEAALHWAAHNGGTRAEIDVGYAREGLRLEVSSDRAIDASEQELRGLGERIALYGGNLEPGGTGSLRVTLPFAAKAAA